MSRFEWATSIPKIKLVVHHFKVKDESYFVVIGFFAFGHVFVTWEVSIDFSVESDIDSDLLL